MPKPKIYLFVFLPFWLLGNQIVFFLLFQFQTAPVMGEKPCNKIILIPKACDSSALTDFIEGWMIVVGNSLTKTEHDIQNLII